MKSLVLEGKNQLALRDFEFEEHLGPTDVRIAIKTVGICGSDIHYYQEGRIGPFVVDEPMVLGHEAAGQVIEVGSEVEHLKPGDRVCMEPGFPGSPGRASREGMYNLDPSIRFWATPPIHGCLRPEVIHPAAFTYPIPENVSFAEAAMVEPLAVGIHAATKANIRPGSVALVTGAGPIGMLTALAAISGGCSQVIITDVIEEKLDIAAKLGPITPVNVRKESISERVLKETQGWGVDYVFESSGHPSVFPDVLTSLCPGGCLVLIGMPSAPVPLDVVVAQVKEVRIEHVFRYAHVYPKAIALLGSGTLDVTPLITDTFAFADSIQAFEFASKMPATSVKAQIVF